MKTCIENVISIKMYADDVYIGSSLLGYQDSFLSHLWGCNVVSKLLPNKVLQCNTVDAEFFLEIEFED